MFGKQSVAIVRGETGARAVWLRGSPGAFEVAKAIVVTAPPDESLAALLSHMRAAKIPLSGLVLGVPGSAATLRYHRLPPVPDWRLKLILKYETEEMAEKSGEPLSSDYMPLEIPESAGDDDVHLLGMGKEHELLPIISEVESVGGQVRKAIPCALGVVHAYFAGQKDALDETVVIADIGEIESHLGIVREGRLLFARTVSFGTGELDDLLVRRLDIKMEEARKVRARAAIGKLPDELSSGFDSTLRTWGGQLGQLVVSSVTFCRGQTKIPNLEPDRLLLAGPGAVLALRTSISTEGIPRTIEPLVPRLGGEALAGNPEEWAPVVGLAAAGIDPRARILDLLPSTFRKKREFRERTRFLYAAAAILVLAVVVEFVAGSVEHRSAKEVKGTVQKWQGNLNSWDQAERTAKAANQKFKERQARLKEEILTGSFHAEILDEVARSIPDAISLDRIDAVRTEIDGEVGIELHLTGYSDNSEGQGIVHMETMRDHFLGLSKVRRSEIEPGDLTEGSYPFKLVVSPDEEMPDASKSKPRPRAGRGRGI